MKRKTLSVLISTAGIALGATQAWADGTITKVGLTGGVYTSSTGQTISGILATNVHGVSTGFAERYSPTFAGEESDAWIYDPGTAAYTIIGPTDAVHLDSAGSPNNYGTAISDNNFAAGYSRKYNGGDTWLGNDAWVYNPITNTSTALSGYSTGINSDGAGFYDHGVSFVNTSAMVVGNAAQFLGTDEKPNQTIWLYNSSSNTYTTLGLTGSSYVSSQGLSNSIAVGLSNSGWIAGNTDGYDGGPYSTYSTTWAYNPTTHTIASIDPTDSKYTSTLSGIHQSYIAAMSSNDLVVGRSDAFLPVGNLRSAVDTWIYNLATGTRTFINIPLVSIYADEGGQSSPQYINSNAMVAGGIPHVIGDNGLSNGADAWIYDSSLDQSFILSFSSRASDQYSSTFIQYLGDNNVALGTYELFSGDDDLGTRLFEWSENGGMVDLGAAVGDLDAQGWASLNQLAGFVDNNPNKIVGEYGYLNDGNGSSAGFYLTIVPEPTSLGMIGIFAIGCLRRRRK